MTETKPESLKPCPHCGSDAGILHQLDVFQVICGDINCKVYKYHETKEAAIKAWNTRAAQPLPVIEGLDEALRLIGFKYNNSHMDKIVDAARAYLERMEKQK